MTPDRNKVYARLALGKIIEYPVPYLNVSDKDLASGVVQEVDVSAIPPDGGKFHNVTSKVVLQRGKPKLVYSLESKSAREFVEENYISVLKPYFGELRLDASTVPLSVIQEMVSAVRDLGTLQLNLFANERGYDTIESLVSYRGDTVNPDFAAEAERGFYLRSQYWSALGNFRDSVMAGDAEFPRTADGILQLFPELTWE